MSAATLEPRVGVREVAAHLGYQKSWVHQQLPLIPHVKIGKSYRFRLTTVDEWFASFLEGDY